LDTDIPGCQNERSVFRIAVDLRTLMKPHFSLGSKLFEAGGSENHLPLLVIELLYRYSFSIINSSALF